MKPTSGEIILEGVDFYTNLKAFRPLIGFVPTKFGLQQNLTVFEVLKDAAVLRLPRSASNHDRNQRVQTLLETVSLAQAADRQVRQLSKFELRKLSIAVELIAYPGLLLLDEPADRLAPFEEAQITRLLQELSRQGLTVIQVNRLNRCIETSDKVIFLAPGGFLAWFGPADEAFVFLRSFMPEKDAVIPLKLEDALEMLAGPNSGDGAEWAKRFKTHPAYQKYVDDPLNNRYPDLLLQTQPLIRLRSNAEEKLPPTIVPRANSAQKLVLLIQRNYRSW